MIWRDLHRPTQKEAEDALSVGRLFVVDSGPTSYQAGHSFPLSGTTALGRGPENQIVLSDSFVSTTHATISYRDKAWWLADLASRNGTWVNGEKIDGEVRLRTGDLITLGQVKLKLRVDS